MHGRPKRKAGFLSGLVRVLLEHAFGERVHPIAVQRGLGTAALDTQTARRLRWVFADLIDAAKSYRDLPYSLHVLGAAEPDVWSYPGGAVYLTRGVLDRLKSWDEVAGLLAHDLAHAALGDAFTHITTDEGRQLVERVANGSLVPTEAVLAKYGVYLLAVTHERADEERANNLARAFLRQAGYDPNALLLAQRRLAAAPRAAYLRTHPHPGIAPYTDPPGRVQVDTRFYLGMEDPLWVPDVKGQAPGTETWAKSPRPSDSGRANTRPVMNLGVSVGTFPIELASGSAQLRHTDRYNDTYQIDVHQRGFSQAVQLGLEGALFVTPSWQILMGGYGLLGASPFADQDGRAHSGYGAQWQLGVGYRPLAAGPVQLSLDLFLAYVQLTGEAGKLPKGSKSELGLQFGSGMVTPGTPITATASGWGPGAKFSVSGHLSPHVTWSLSAGHVQATGSPYRYTAKDQFEETHEIPFTQTPDLPPFHASGTTLTAGVGIQF